jgi:hypothetical protein
LKKNDIVAHAREITDFLRSMGSFVTFKLKSQSTWVGVIRYSRSHCNDADNLWYVTFCPMTWPPFLRNQILQLVVVDVTPSF